MPQVDTPPVAATGATTVWTNAPQGPPSIGAALVLLSHSLENEDFECSMSDLDVQVTLNDGTVIKPVIQASKLDRATEIVTANMIYVVVTTDIVRVSYSNHK
jgi:hypothetical protein